MIDGLGLIPIKLVKKWMSVIGFDTRDRTAILESEAVLCQSCKRARTEKRYEWIADTISYYIVYVVILPIILILTVPTGSFRILWQRMVDVERNDMEEFYRLFHEKHVECIINVFIFEYVNDTQYTEAPHG
eukprot:202181_1